MTDWLRTLYFEQTTPDEVIVFLLLWTGVALAAAFVLYVLVIVLLGAVRRPEDRVSIARLVFPSRERLKQYAVEYAVAGSTGLLLFLTVTAKHSLVQTVLDQPVDGVMTAADVRRVLPLGAPTEAELRAAGASEAEARQAVAALSGDAAGVGELARMPVEPVVRSLLDAGLPENAGVLLRLAVRSAEDRLQLEFPTREHLLIAAVLLLLGYAVWFGWDRSRRGKAAAFGNAEHGEVVRRLGVPALCIPLLLVSAAAVDDLERRLTRSAEAVASVGAGDALEAEGLGWLTRFAEARVDSLAVQIPPDRVAGRLSRIDALLSDRGETLAALETALDGLDARFAGLEARAGGLEGRFMEDSAASRVDRDALAEEVLGLEGATDGLSAEVRALTEELDRARTAADSLRLLADRLRSDYAALGERMGALTERLQNLASQLPNAGLVFVVHPMQDNYAIRSDPQGAADGQGTYVGLHQLPPGDYVVTGNNVQPQSIVVDAGGAQTVRLSTGFVVQ